MSTTQDAPFSPSQGQTIWITGLSGAGKSTLARAVVRHFRTRGIAAVLLDGDELRDVFGAAQITPANHDREGRLALALRYAHLCHMLSMQGLTVVIATISLFHEVHRWNRKNLPNYFEVFLDVPFDELQRRDPKGIYRRFASGELTHVAGLDVAVDIPETADWVVRYDQSLDPDTLASNLLNRLTITASGENSRED